jgi:tRNA threonylcarbamoyladenosine modification (KEOPS) complex  Pcc1 subunit
VSELSSWTAVVRIHRAQAADAERLFAALEPEAAREVPRTRVELRRPAPETVEITVRARDTGALRAGVNTFLGWIALAERTEAELR